MTARKEIADGTAGDEGRRNSKEEMSAGEGRRKGGILRSRRWHLFTHWVKEREGGHGRGWQSKTWEDREGRRGEIRRGGGDGDATRRASVRIMSGRSVCSCDRLVTTNDVTIQKRRHAGGFSGWF